MRRGRRGRETPDCAFVWPRRAASTFLFSAGQHPALRQKYATPYTQLLPVGALTQPASPRAPQVGLPVPAERRIGFCRQMFKLVDEENDGELKQDEIKARARRAWQTCAAPHVSLSDGRHLCYPGCVAFAGPGDIPKDGGS